MRWRWWYWLFAPIIGIIILVLWAYRGGTSEPQYDIATQEFMTCFGSQKGDANWPTCQIYDLNNDGVIDIFDAIKFSDVKYGLPGQTTTNSGQPSNQTSIPAVLQTIPTLNVKLPVQLEEKHTGFALAFFGWIFYQNNYKAYLTYATPVSATAANDLLAALQASGYYATHPDLALLMQMDPLAFLNTHPEIWTTYPNYWQIVRYYY